MTSFVRKASTFAFSIACSFGLTGLVAPSGAFAQSIVTGSTPGNPVNPSVYDVFLDTGDPLNIPITVTVPATPTKLDLVLLEDLSGSFFNDLPVLKSLVPNLVSSLTSMVPDTLFGVSSFVDKPVLPFGDQFSGDFLYRTDLGLTSDTALLQSSVNSLFTTDGSDLAEGQLEALLQIAVRAKSEIGFRDDAFKVVVLSTDAIFHQAGDGLDAFGDPDGDGNPGIQTPNNGDAILDGNPAGTGEDYPTIEQVKTALMDAGIVPIFAITSGTLSSYQNLVDQFGFGTVVELSDSSSNLVDAILAGLEDITRDITLVPVNDDFGYVDSIIPSDFSSVPAGESRTFQVSLLSDGTGRDDTLKLVAPGFGETVVNVDVDDVTVPEPSSVLGLLAMSSFGVASAFKRKRNQKVQ
ncbi:MAG TPA: hypothetical protein DCL61_28810 [Cyanobacteria bacterium UBA12227]|nr:hypothetical protein [Cyanobacteria bacterium UBA12227]HAX87842.1 hypothetical protein [Cyanobacteria bacterium UBA11370]